MEKFNYQLVLKCSNTGNRVIFAGVTTLSVKDLLNDCLAYIHPDESNFLEIENFVYQPKNSISNESQETSK